MGVQDQELSVRLKADGSGLVGEVRSSAAEIDKLGASVDKANAKMAGLNSQQKALLESFKQQTQVAKVSEASLADLENRYYGLAESLNPAAKAASAMTQGQNILAATLKNGLITQKEYDDTLARLIAKYGPAANGAAALAGGHGALAGNTAFATREVRALFDELASGRDRQALGTSMLLATRIGGIGLAGLGAIAGVAGLFGVLALGVVTAEHNAQALNEVEVRFTATGRAGLVARDGVQGMIDQMAVLPGMSRSSAQATVAALASVPTLSAPMFKNLAGLLDDFARATGQNATQAAKALGQAFEDPAKGAQTFQKQLNLLTADQLLHIQTLERQGRVMEAQQALYDALKARVKGLAEQGMAPLEHSTDGLGRSWDTFTQKLANSSPVQGAIGMLTALLNAVSQADKRLSQPANAGLPSGETAGGAVAGRSGRGQLGMHPLPEKPVPQIGWDVGFDAAGINQYAAKQAADQAQITSALELGRSYEGVAGQMSELQDRAKQLRGALELAVGSGQSEAAAHLRNALAGVGEQMRRLGADNLLVQLQQKLASLIPLSTEVDRVTRQLVQGTEKHTQANRDAILATAAKIDAMEREKKEIEALSKINLERAAAADEQGKAYADAYNQNMNAVLDFNNRARQAQIATIADSQARTKAQFDYEMYLEAQKLAALQRNGVASEMVEDAYSKYVLSRQGQLTEQLKPQWQKMLDGWSDTTRRMRESYDSLQLGVQQAGEQIAVEFGRTGRLSGQSLIYAFQDELSKSAYRKYFAPLASAGVDAFASLLPDIFGSRGSTGPSSAGAGDLMNVNANVGHTGGVFGTDSLPSRSVPAALFANAPRFHSGIGPGEMPAIIKNDESVLTPGQMKALGGPSSIKVEVINQAGNAVAASDAKVRFDPEGMIVQVILKDDRTNGPISQMLSARSQRSFRS